MATAVGLFLGVAQLAPLLVQLSQDWVIGPIQSLKHAPQQVRDLEILGLNLHRGKLKLDIELAAWAYEQDDVDQDIKYAIEEYITRLRTTLLNVGDVLNKIKDRDGNLKKAYFAFLGKKRVVKAGEDLRNWQHDFERMIRILDMKKRLLPNDPFLTRDQLRLTASYQPISVQGASQLFFSKAEHKAGDVQQINILLERKPYGPKDSGSVKDITSSIASKLRNSSPNDGILKCLGYQESLLNGFDLVFLVPDGLENPRTLQSAISAMSDEEISEICPLEQQLRLCRRICEAVYSIHVSGLVHKSIRPESVILFSQSPSPKLDETELDNTETESAFLMNWYMIRKAADLSSRRGESDWTKNIYRHPQRQGFQPESRYNMGHDIYSLGVTLLEIVLWESFVQIRKTPLLSSRYREMAIWIGKIPAQDQNNISKLTAPLLVQKVMIEVARREVRSRMGSEVAKFIISCLTCLEGSMGEKEDFEKRPGVVAVKFDELILQSFPNANSVS